MAVSSLIAYIIEPGGDTRFVFQVPKTGLMRGKKHDFEFTRYRGQWLYCPDMPEKSSVELTIAADSLLLKDAWIGRGDAKRVTKMAIHKMLTVSAFPELAFASSCVSPRADGRYDVDGTLTLRSIVKPARVIFGVEQPDGETVRLSGHAEIKLTDYRIKPPSFLFGVIGTRDEIAVEFELMGQMALSVRPQREARLSTQR